MGSFFRPRPTPPVVPPVHVHRENLTVSGIALETQLKTTLWIDGDDAPYVGERDMNFPQIGRFSFFVKSPPSRLGWGGHLHVEADGYVPIVNLSVPTGTSDHELQSQVLEKLPTHTNRPPSRLVTRERRLLRSDGLPWNWQGLTAFRLAEMIHAGHQAEVDAYCAWAAAHDVTLLRVLTMAGSHNGNGVPYLFTLAPEDGRRALPALLTIAAAYGLYVEAVCLADTKFFDFDHRQHVVEIGQIAAANEIALVQIANEPDHSTHLGEIADPTYLAMLRALVPADIPTTLGAAHGGNDFEFKWMRGGDYGTVHLDRADGEDHFTHDGAGLRWVRHIKDALDTSETLDKYVANDEPRRNDLAPFKHLAVALICRILGIGDTFHYGGGLQGTIPEGAELAAFEARQRGWNAIPVDWHGAFKNVGHAGSPVTSADWSTVLKVFSAVMGDTTYTVALGSPSPRFTWADDWPTRELVIHEGGTALYRVTR